MIGARRSNEEMSSVYARAVPVLRVAALQELDDALLADILEHPDDDTPRLVYADWLDDQTAKDAWRPAPSSSASNASWPDLNRPTASSTSAHARGACTRPAS